MFHPYFHLLAIVCDYRPTRRFEGGVLLYQCLVNAIIHSPDVSCHAGCLYIVAGLCPILVCTLHRGVLNLAPGSYANLQVPFAG